MYKSPLTEICENIASQMTKQREDSLVYEIRQTIGYNIDKEELIKALQYDRNQYQKGYADAMAVIDDIKTEINEERECAYADFERYKVEYLGIDPEYVEDELPNDDFRYGMERCLEIIDKHIGEKE